MEQRKEHFTAFEADQAAEKPVAEVVDCVQVTVGEQHLFAVRPQLEGIIENFHAQIVAKEIIEPEIVIAADQNQATTVLTNFRQTVEDGKILFYDGEFPVEPKVENIAVEHHHVILADRLLEKIQDDPSAFPIRGVFGRVFVMNVGNYADSHLSSGKAGSR